MNNLLPSEDDFTGSVAHVETQSTDSGLGLTGEVGDIHGTRCLELDRAVTGGPDGLVVAIEKNAVDRHGSDETLLRCQTTRERNHGLVRHTDAEVGALRFLELHVGHATRIATRP